MLSISYVIHAATGIIIFITLLISEHGMSYTIHIIAFTSLRFIVPNEPAGTTGLNILARAAVRQVCTTIATQNIVSITCPRS